MDTKFMNSENSKTCDPHRLLLNISDKINLKGSDKYMALSNLSIYYTWQNVKKSYKNNKFKILALKYQSLNYLMDHIVYQIFNIQDYFKYILKEISVYANKIENRIAFRIKTGYYLELLTPEAMKVLERTTVKDK